MQDKNLATLNKCVSKFCNTSCPDKNGVRCCGAIFCKDTENYLNQLGIKYNKPNHKGVPYLSKEGCVVKPKHRPICTLFACTAVLENKKIAKKWYKMEPGLKKKYVKITKELSNE